MYLGKYFDNHSLRKCDTLGARLAELRSTVQNSLKDMELVILFCYRPFSSHSQTFRKGKDPNRMDTRSSSTVYIFILTPDQFLTISSSRYLLPKSTFSTGQRKYDHAQRRFLHPCKQRLQVVFQ